MVQVVVQDFELQGIPQPSPRAAEDAIDKFPPQLTKGSFDLLAYLTEDKAVSRGLIAGNEQHVCHFRQFSLENSGSSRKYSRALHTVNRHAYSETCESFEQVALHLIGRPTLSAA